MIQGALLRSNKWKIAMFPMLVFGVAVFQTLPHKPANNVPATALWATATARVPVSIRFANWPHSKFLVPQVARQIRAHSAPQIARQVRVRAENGTETEKEDIFQFKGKKLLSEAEVTKNVLLSSAEVPPHIPRDDLVDQLAGFAENEAGDN